MTDGDAQFFAPGGKRDLFMVLAVLSVLAYAIFGWYGVVAVLSIPAAFIALCALAFVIVGATVVAAMRDVETEINENADQETENK